MLEQKDELARKLDKATRDNLLLMQIIQKADVKAVYKKEPSVSSTQKQEAPSSKPMVPKLSKSTYPGKKK